MKLVVQRVKKAKVLIQGTQEVVGEIEKGLFVLLGVKKGDTKKDAEILAEKLFKLRIMADENGKMNLSIKDIKGEILVVSQFTLNADTSKGNRPSFIKAAEPRLAQEIYEHFVSQLKEKGIKVETGQFGAYMQIKTELDGPVTICLKR
jgi:D-tyrosyl-tRNA(Tyr) deacylase